MINDKFDLSLRTALQLPGDFIQFSARDSTTTCKIAIACKSTRKRHFIIEDQQGVQHISEKDATALESDKLRIGMRKVNIPLLLPQLIKSCGTIEHVAVKDNTSKVDSTQLAFAYIDSSTYDDTKTALEFVKSNAVDGCMIYIRLYDESKKYQSHLAVTEFLKEYMHSVNASRQMIVNGTKESFLIIRLSKESNVSRKQNLDPISIALVLKTGGDTFNAKYVNALAGNIKKYITVPHKIVCLTDDVSGIDRSLVDIIKPLRHNLPKWWSKIEMFNSQNFDTSRVLYLDLDTVIVDNIDNIAKLDCNFIGIRDFFHMFTLQTGVLMWRNGKYDKIYTKFMENSDKIIKSMHGDHEWIGQCVTEYEFLQDIVPNEVVSYKKHNLADKVPERAKICCFHGTPRPHTVSHQFVLDNWKYK